MKLSSIVRHATLLCALTLCYVSGHAVQAYQGAMTVTNPDGTTIEVYQKGDEWFNFLTSTDGYLVAQNDKGYYNYAQVVDGAIVATEYAVCDPALRSAELNDMLATCDTRMMISKVDRRDFSIPDDGIGGPSRSASNGTAEKRESFPTIGSPHVLVMLVQFPDYKFNYSTTQFKNWLNKVGYNYDNGTGKATGSVYDYYYATSNGQFKPQFDVVGPLTAPQNRSYYGNGQSNSSQRVAALVSDLCKTLSSNGTVDFSNYDANNDGVIDIVYMVFAGPGAADYAADRANSIWPHKWDVYYGGGSRPTLNGKVLKTYGCSAELSYGKYFSAIGTFSHEFGHCLGLGDHYDVDYCGNRNPDDWDIMAGGSYNNYGQTPPLFSAYERHVMGWITPEHLTKADNYLLTTNSTAEGYDQAYIIPTTKDNEYFVLENRQQTGWDKYLPSHGMLIWHIDYNSSVWSSNRINCTEHQYVDIEEAGGPSVTNEAATPFPGSTNNRTFADDTTPSMKMWSGASLRSPLTYITETDGCISFKFKGGIALPSELELLEPSTLHNQATLSWKPITGVKSYEITITDPATGNVLANEVTVNGTSYTIAGLDEKTTYEYTVTYCKDYIWYDTKSSFTTAVSPLYLRTPQNIVTTEVGDTYFITEWDDLELADRYSVTVYQGEVGGATTETESFDNKTFQPGWTADSDEFIETTGYYGASAPSLRLATSQSVMSTTFPGNVTKVTFKHRRIGSTNGSITLYGLNADTRKWVELQTKSSGSSKASFSWTKADDNEYHQIKLTQVADGASVMVDDISVTLDSSVQLTPVEGKEKMDAGATPTHTVWGLDYDTQYYYTVRGHNDEHDSVESVPVPVKTDIFTGIDNIVSDSSSAITVEGTVVTVTTDCDAVTGIYTAAGTAVISPVKLQAASTASFQLPAPGVYLIKVGTKVYKAVAQ